MEQAINAYEKITITPEFQELERLRSRARHNEASAIYNAEQRGREEERVVWQSVVADQAAENEKLRLQIAELQSKVGG